MSLPRPRQLCTIVLCGVLASVQAFPRIAAAADPNGASAENKAAAAEHFRRAKDLYQQGAYREAISELEAATALDPDAKILVYNLGVVHEKLGNIEDALRYFHHYETMNLTQEERDKAEAYIRRLEGAKKELDDRRKAEELRRQQEQQQQQQQQQQQGPHAATPPARNGRIDAITIATASLAVVGAGVGAYFGIAALRDRPPSDITTSSQEPYSTYQDQHDTSHREAMFADISFGVAAAAAVATLILYFTRPAVTSTPAKTGTTVSAAPSPGGATLLLGGSF